MKKPKDKDKVPRNPIAIAARLAHRTEAIHQEPSEKRNRTRREQNRKAIEDQENSHD